MVMKIMTMMTMIMVISRAVALGGFQGDVLGWCVCGTVWGQLLELSWSSFWESAGDHFQTIPSITIAVIIVLAIIIKIF